MQIAPITPQQIQALRFAAYKSGDRALMRQCDLAALGQEAALREVAHAYRMSEVA